MGNLKETIWTIAKIILIFTALDFFIHLIANQLQLPHLVYVLPSYYFINKIIFGVILGVIAYKVVERKELWTQTWIIALAVGIGLQIRYYSTDYPLDFVLYYMVIHVVILLGVAWLILKNEA